MDPISGWGAACYLFNGLTFESANGLDISNPGSLRSIVKVFNIWETLGKSTGKLSFERELGDLYIRGEPQFIAFLP